MKHPLLQVAGFILFTLLVAAAFGTEPESDRPRIGLVLSGGGARGAAHIGVLKVLEAQRVPVDCIAGTSMGAIVGGLYASGMSAEEIEQAILEIDWKDILKDDTSREKLSFRRKRDEDEFLLRSEIGLNRGEVQLPMGLIQGQKLLLELKALTRPVAGVRDFDRLPIPFRAVATDIATGKEVVIGKGDLATAMRASASIPSAFAPVEMDGRLLVDGGVSDNLPVRVARQMCADVLIVVDISTPLRKQEEITDALAVADQLTNIMTRGNTERSLALLDAEDLLLVPDLGDITTLDFPRSGEAVPLGEEAARRIADRLARWSLDEERWLAWQAGRQGGKRRALAPRIAFVRIRNDSGLSDEVLRQQLGIRPGEPLDTRKLEAGISRIYGTDLFQLVTYHLERTPEGTGLVVEARAKRWGPNYLDWSLRFYGDWHSGNGLDVGVGYTRTAINPLGGEFRAIVRVGENPDVFVELYQPLDYHQPFFLNPQLELMRRSVGFFFEGDQIAQYDFRQLRFSLDLGKELGSWGEVRLGYQYAYDRFRLEIGDPVNLPEGSEHEGQLYLQFSTDTFDNLYFPSRGHRGGLGYHLYRRSLGGDHDFEQLTGYWTAVGSLGRNTLLVHARAAYQFGKEAEQSIYGRQDLGGFLHLSGYARHELSGSYLAFGYVGLLRRLNERFSTVPIYLGATLETGNTWEFAEEFGKDWIMGGSLFLGFDTFLGPLYLGVGAAEEDHQSAFVYLGSPF